MSKRAALAALLGVLIGASSLFEASAQASPTAARMPKKFTAVAAGLAEDTVEVKVNYSGARVVLFADSPAADEPNTGFAVALIGPLAPRSVTHNTPTGPKHFDFVSAPTVFAIAAEPAVAAATTPEVMAEAGLNVAAAALPRVDKLNAPDLQLWRDAFVKLMVDKKLYSFDDAAIEKLDGGLRRVRMSLPPNAPPGVYQVRAVVFRNGKKIGETTQKLTLVRGGADATLFDLSKQHGFIYGFVAVLTGALVGGIAAFVGRR